MDYVLLPKRMLGRLLHMKLWRGECGGMSDHFLVEVRLKLVGGWRSAVRMKSVRNLLKMNELNNRVKESAYQESLRGKYEVWKGGGGVNSVEEWEKFRDTVMECDNDMCGMRRLGGLGRKRSEWWNEEVGRAVAEKRRAFEEWLQRRDWVTYDRYRAQRVVVKRAVQVAKRIADRRWRERLRNDFEFNKRMFWKEVKIGRQGEQARDEMVKDVNGQILRDGVEVRWRLAEYFEQVLCVLYQRGKYQCSWQLADAGVGRYE